MNKIKKIILSVLGFIFFIFIFEYVIKPIGSVKIVIKDIESEFEGVVIKKYSLRKTEPTHLKIRTVKGDMIDISPDNKIVVAAKIGDSINKPKNENFIFLSRQGYKKKFFYTRISHKDRKHRKFPEEWKNKWLNSSEWNEQNVNN